MEIKDRLLKIISSEGLNSSAFADSIGVQRSSISHILSGRNKPSIDFLEKILSTYPKYNAEWLIMGAGEITKTPKQPSLFETGSVSQVKESLEAVPAAEEEPITPNPKVADSKNHSNLGMLQTKIGINEEPIITHSNTTTPKEAANKTIDKIVFFYSDRTFTEYQPDK